MFLIILAVLVFIGGIVGGGLHYQDRIVIEKEQYLDRQDNTYKTRDKQVNKGQTIVFGLRKLQLLALIAFIIPVFGMFRQIDATEVVVVTRFGEVQEVIGTPGFKTKSPLDSYHKYSLKIQEIRYDNIEDQGISFYSRDSQPVEASLTVQWRIKGDEAQTIYENFGGDVENVRARLGSLVVERTKSSLSLSTAEDLISSRSALSASIEALIVAEIGVRDMPVTIVAVYLTDFAFSQAFEDAVELKMIADQQRLKAETEKQIAIVQAQQQLETTVLQAQAALERAKGEANAILAIAQSEAAALSAKIVDVSRTLGFPVTQTVNVENGLSTYTIDTTGRSADEIKVIFDYVQYIAYLQTWNGQLPNVITDGSGIIIQP